jgi:hypothetical protein
LPDIDYRLHYNPLFLYGGVGMGKTHLMHAIGHTIKQRNPAMRLSYVSAEKFTIEVINSIRFDRMISFRDRFHTVDVLLVDDIQFITGDKTIVVTRCGRIYVGRKKINFNQVFAGQAVDIKEAHDDNWLVSLWIMIWATRSGNSSARTARKSIRSKVLPMS